MNNNILESYVPFEITQLLKEKGCTQLSKTIMSDFPYYDTCTHALAIEWIRCNFDIHIYTYCDGRTWRGSLQKTTGSIIKIFPDNSSPQEATEFALLYTLKNLI